MSASLALVPSVATVPGSTAALASSLDALCCGTPVLQSTAALSRRCQDACLRGHGPALAAAAAAGLARCVDTVAANLATLAEDFLSESVATEAFAAGHPSAPRALAHGPPLPPLTVPGAAPLFPLPSAASASTGAAAAVAAAPKLCPRRSLAFLARVAAALEGLGAVTARLDAVLPPSLSLTRAEADAHGHGRDRGYEQSHSDSSSSSSSASAGAGAQSPTPSQSLAVAIPTVMPESRLSPPAPPAPLLAPTALALALAGLPSAAAFARARIATALLTVTDPQSAHSPSSLSSSLSSSSSSLTPAIAANSINEATSAAGAVLIAVEAAAVALVAPERDRRAKQALQHARAGAVAAHGHSHSAHGPLAMNDGESSINNHHTGFASVDGDLAATAAAAAAAEGLLLLCGRGHSLATAHTAAAAKYYATLARTHLWPLITQSYDNNTDPSSSSSNSSCRASASETADAEAKAAAVAEADAVVLAAAVTRVLAAEHSLSLPITCSKIINNNNNSSNGKANTMNRTATAAAAATATAAGSGALVPASVAPLTAIAVLCGSWGNRFAHTLASVLGPLLRSALRALLSASETEPNTSSAASRGTLDALRVLAPLCGQLEALGGGPAAAAFVIQELSGVIAETAATANNCHTRISRRSSISSNSSRNNSISADNSNNSNTVALPSSSVVPLAELIGGDVSCPALTATLTTLNSDGLIVAKTGTSGAVRCRSGAGGLSAPTTATATAAAAPATPLANAIVTLDECGVFAASTAITNSHINANNNNNSSSRVKSDAGSVTASESAISTGAAAGWALLRGLRAALALARGPLAPLSAARSSADDAAAAVLGIAADGSGDPAHSGGDGTHRAKSAAAGVSKVVTAFAPAAQRAAIAALIDIHGHGHNSHTHGHGHSHGHGHPSAVVSAAVAVAEAEARRRAVAALALCADAVLRGALPYSSLSPTACDVSAASSANSDDRLRSVRARVSALVHLGRLIALLCRKNNIMNANTGARANMSISTAGKNEETVAALATASLALLRTRILASRTATIYNTQKGTCAVAAQARALAATVAPKNSPRRRRHGAAAFSLPVDANAVPAVLAAAGVTSALLAPDTDCDNSSLASVGANSASVIESASEAVATGLARAERDAAADAAAEAVAGSETETALLIRLALALAAGPQPHESATGS